MGDVALKSFAALLIWAGTSFAAVAGSWSASEKLEVGRTGLAATAIGDLVYVGGGSSAGDPRSTFDVFDAARESWRPLPAMPKGLQYFGIAAAGGVIYVAGGFSSDAPGTPRAEMWMFDPQSASWTERKAMPRA